MNTLNRHEHTALQRAVLEIDVVNHAGVMAHVIGLFSRRACNVDGIACLPLAGDPAHSRIWLLVNDDTRLPAMLRQVEKLEDVRSVRRHPGEHAVFAHLGAHFRA